MAKIIGYVRNGVVHPIVALKREPSLISMAPPEKPKKDQDPAPQDEQKEGK